MPLLKSTITNQIPTFLPSTPLINVINFMNGQEEFAYKNLNYQEYSSLSQPLDDGLTQSRDCVFIVKESHLLGIFTVTNLLNLPISEVNNTEITIAEVMNEPTISVRENLDVDATFKLMCEHNLKYLPIIAEDGKFLGVWTPETIAKELQIRLANTKQQLEKEIAQRCSLELVLKKKEEELEKQQQQLEELLDKNQGLQHDVNSCIATETQLLLATSELQEIFQAFPDIYFRLTASGKILSHHAKDTSELYLPPDAFLGRKAQDILPKNIADKVEQAIVLVNQTNTLVTIEYSLVMSKNDKSFEARFLPSTQQQIIVIIRDITERKQAQLALQKAKEELECRVKERTYKLKKTEERYIRAIYAGKVGIWEWNIDTNEIFIDHNLKAMLGYADDEISNCFYDWLNLIHPDDVEIVKVQINAYVEGLVSKYEVEHRMQHKDGSYIWFLGRGTILCDTETKACFIAGSNADITSSKYTENCLKASLKEKEVLLKEIHHRVKNNLQVISSLLRLQAGYIKDEQALEIFRDSQNRVRAMAMIHESLYQSSDLGRINFSSYIHNLTNNLIRCYDVKNNTNIFLGVDDVLLRIDTAIPCGLIINELVSNSIKHAFTGETPGEIYVDFKDLGRGKYSLGVSDNGVGVPDDIEERRNKTLGLQLVWGLVEQLEGSIAFNNKFGTLFTITFAESN